ncbi:unnamed protein product [Paramecium primaurelia]|uniref:Uncharacterized protein n=1 Tax=Paramecium primaurelia TaxID=5886 RepID=A0A8S1PQ85_PARPR|nr:unnamed protein product [Paramecium primaurelia]
MVRSLVLLSLLIVSYTMTIKINGCTCEEVLKQEECDNYHPDGNINCDWNEQKNTCDSDPKVTCSLIDGQELCRAQSVCGWVENKCVDFKQCSDYKETVDQKCNNINHQCIVLEDDKCGKKKPLECESLANEVCKSTSESICVLYGDPAKCITMKSCDQGSYNEEQCKRSFGSCVWDTNKCREKKCSDILVKDQCRFFSLSLQPSYATLCHWTAEGKCIDGEDEHYTAETCFSESAYSKVWKDNKCQSCADSPVDSKALSIIMILFAIIMM